MKSAKCSEAYLLRKIDIIFEDDYLIVADKPPGILVIPTPKQEKHTLTHLINGILQERGLEVKAHPCHRLDRETSGLIIFAKGKKNQQLMMEQFHSRKVEKTYMGFAQGILNKEQGLIRNHIEGKEAVTKYKVLEEKDNFSVVQIQPITGRTNQIRIHFKQIGHPLVGERRFAFAKDYSLKFRRAALHAFKLAFNHPVTGARINLHSPLAVDMKDFLKKYN